MLPTQSGKRNGARGASCGLGSQGDQTVHPHSTVHHSRTTSSLGPPWWGTVSKGEELVVVATATMIKMNYRAIML